jgi:hypothetical protein
MAHRRVSGFTQLREFGAGGQDSVVLARHDGSGQLFAIKYVTATDDLPRFRAEAQVPGESSVSQPCSTSRSKLRAQPSTLAASTGNPPPRPCPGATAALPKPPPSGRAHRVGIPARRPTAPQCTVLATPSAADECVAAAHSCGLRIRVTAGLSVIRQFGLVARVAEDQHRVSLLLIQHVLD